MSSVLTVEEAVAGLEEEQTCLGVIVIRGYTEGPETFTLSQQLLFSGIGPLVRRSLSEEKHAALTQCSDGTREQKEKHRCDIKLLHLDLAADESGTELTWK